MLQVCAITTGPRGASLLPCLGAAEAMIVAEARNGAELIILPELFALPYVAAEDPTCWMHLAERFDGPVGAWAAEIASRLGIHLVYGMAIRDADVSGEKRAALNAAMLALPDGALRICAEKINLPPAAASGFGEADHFRPGAPVAPFTIGDVTVAVIICFDRRYPECWRHAMEAGADLAVILLAGPAPEDPPGIFEAEIRTHARANAMHAIAAARCGTEILTPFPVTHDGTSLAVGPDGTFLMMAARQPGSAVHLTLTPEVLERARKIRRIRTTGRERYQTFLERKAL